jgi:hypothetical protein
VAEQISINQRDSRAARCAICHDEARPLKQCPRCASLFHDACRRELRRCPTIGCRSMVDSDSGDEHEEEREDQEEEAASPPAAEATPAFSTSRAFLWSALSGLVPIAFLLLGWIAAPELFIFSL